MPEDTPPASPPPRRSPRRKRPPAADASARPDDRAESAREQPHAKTKKTATGAGATGSSRERGTEAGSRLDAQREPDEGVFDEVVDYGNAVRDLDRMASRNPRTAMLGALAVGFLIGFGVGILAAGD